AATACTRWCSAFACWRACTRSPPEPAMTDTPDPAPSPEAPAAPASAEPKLEVFKDDVLEALKTVHDPEIPVNVYDLGLIYDVTINDENDVLVKMTLTTPNCPEAQNIPSEVQRAVRDWVPGVRRVQVEIVWEPRWTKDLMS